LSPRLHSQGHQILRVLRQHGIEVLFHFTSVQNLKGISEMNGLCSKKMLSEAGRWPPPWSGGDQLSHNLDMSCGNWDMVSLSYVPNTPMAYHRKQQEDLCFVEVDPSVATWSGVLFTNTNAASLTASRLAGLRGVKEVDFDEFASVPAQPGNPTWKRAVQAEVLVPQFVPLGYVVRVSFKTPEHLKQGARSWGSQPSHFEVRADRFRNR